MIFQLREKKTKMHALLKPMDQQASASKRLNKEIITLPKGVQFIGSLPSCAQPFFYVPGNATSQWRSRSRQRVDTAQTLASVAIDVGTVQCCNAHGHVPSEELGFETEFKNYEGHLVLRGDVVEDDSGSNAVFVHRARIFSVAN